MSEEKVGGRYSTKPKILVTGGAGYIGSHTVLELLDAGYEPIIFDNFSNSNRGVISTLEQLAGRSLTLYEADCCDPAAVDKVFVQEQDIRGVIHFAAYKSVSESVSHPLKYYQNNINSLLCVLESMQRHGVVDLVFSSTCAVYGAVKGYPVTEETPVGKAVSPYAETKQICESIINDLVTSEGLIKTVTLRYFNPIGAHPSGLIGEAPPAKPENILPYLTQTAAGIREVFTVYGDDYQTPDGTCIRDYIHVMDLAKAHIHALSWLGKQISPSFNEIFNVGTGQGCSVKELLESFDAIVNEPFNVRFGPRRAGDIAAIYARVEKAREVLGWEAKKSIHEALEDAWAWQQNLLARPV